MRWCGIRGVPGIGVFAVPMSIYRYNWTESQFTISPLECFGEVECEVGLAGSRRPGDDDHGRSVHALSLIACIQ